ncbi:MAG: hypothetical protein GX765_06280 [Candidatus Moranbacteria bacterium]|nr:hypothetical protein [Candidatus Moranbacteria bacterium]
MKNSRITAIAEEKLCRLLGNPKSVFTRTFDPADFLGKGWATWKGPLNGDGLSGEEDVDSRSLALTEIELAKFLFETCILAGEEAITGEEKLRRLKERPEFIRCGGSVFYALWLDYEANKENSILEWLDRNFQVTSLDFMGQILRSPSDLRYVLCLCRDDYYGEWGWHYDWLGYLWGARNFSVGC